MKANIKRLGALALCLSLLLTLLPALPASAVEPLTLVSVSTDPLGKTLLLTFSEPMTPAFDTGLAPVVTDTTGRHIVDKTGVSVSEDDDCQLVVNLEAPLLSALSYKARVAGVRAVSGATMAAGTVSIANTITPCPTVTSAVCDNTGMQLQITYSEALSGSNINRLHCSLATNGFNAINAVTLSADKKTLLVSLFAPIAKQATASFTINILGDPTQPPLPMLMAADGRAVDTRAAISVVSNATAVPAATLNGVAATAIDNATAVTVVPTNTQLSQARTAAFDYAQASKRFTTFADRNYLYIALGNAAATSVTLQLSPAQLLTLGDTYLITGNQALGVLYISEAMAAAATATGGTVRLTLADIAYTVSGETKHKLSVSFKQAGKLLDLGTLADPAQLFMPTLPPASGYPTSHMMLTRVLSGSSQRVPRSWYHGGYVAGVLTQQGEYRIDYLTPNSYIDLPSWATSQFYYLNTRGVVGGISNNKLGSKNNITRADFILLLMRALDADNTEIGTTKQFADVAVSKYYAKAVLQARALKFVGGTGNNTFAPEKPISRQDACVMLDNIMKRSGIKLTGSPKTPVTGFADWGKVSSYARTAVTNLYDVGLMAGSNNQINPTDNLTRAEATVIIARLLQKEQPLWQSQTK